MSLFRQKFLKSSIDTLNKQKYLAENTFLQLNDEDFYTKFNLDDNSIAMIMKHMAGNMLSRWTNFKTEDGEKEWRNRDTEFADDLRTKAELMDYWNKGWSCCLEALNSVTEEELDTSITIRGESCLIIEAIVRQLCHYSHHIGQIVFIGKSIKNKDWKTLSIAKGQSKAFNANPQKYWEDQNK